MTRARGLFIIALFIITFWASVGIGVWLTLD